MKSIRHQVGNCLYWQLYKTVQKQFCIQPSCRLKNFQINQKLWKPFFDKHNQFCSQLFDQLKENSYEIN